MIADNLKSIRQRITRCCEKVGRSPESVELVCVTKEALLPAIEEVLRLGVKNIGENRVQDALAKYEVIGNKARWHLIGHLQTNKAHDAVKIFSLIHSVDSIRLAREIDKEAAKSGKAQDILIQVNTSGERTKFGIAPKEIAGFFNEVILYPNIHIQGLMTIAPLSTEPELARPCFRMLREMAEELQANHIAGVEMKHLSMGMSNDFEIAIEEGATMVRIGSAIFKDGA